MAILLAQSLIVHGAMPIAHCPLAMALSGTTGSAFPAGDWQFWVATLMASIAIGWLLRAVIPFRRILRQSPRKRGRRATLTLERKPLDGARRRSGGGGGSGCH